jgi:thiosulfate/3-mercaptopyruvate sulfurtransferase
VTGSAIVTVDWLRERLGEDGLVVVDVRAPYFYEQGHIPGAVNLPIMMLSTPSDGVPTAATLARRLGELGIRRGSHIVICDDGANNTAGRLFWLLDLIAHARISLLSGGVTKWHRDGLDIVGDASTVGPPTEYELGEGRHEALAGIDDVRAAMGSPNAVIIDSRSPAEYMGLQRSAARDGHIPGAINIDWTNNFTRGDDGVAQLKSFEELRLLYETAAATPDKHVIVHCQTGARSSLTYAVLKALGYADVSNYSAGWQEWGNRQDTPVESA